MEKAKKIIKTLFITRVVLWIIAAGVTLYWIVFQYKLYLDGIHDPYEYATILRPILYTCLIIAIVALAIAFILRRIMIEIKRQNNIR